MEHWRVWSELVLFYHKLISPYAYGIFFQVNCHWILRHLFRSKWKRPILSVIFEYIFLTSQTILSTLELYHEALQYLLPTILSQCTCKTVFISLYPLNNGLTFEIECFWSVYGRILSQEWYFLWQEIPYISKLLEISITY